MQSQELERNWANVHFLLLVPQRGMHFQPTYATTMTLLHLNVNLRLICLPQHLMCNPYMSLFYPHCSYGLCNTLLDVYFIDFCN